jgi:hypothetical protein
MAYEWTAICDACGTRETFLIESFGDTFPRRPLPPGWTHVHEGGRPGVVTPEIGVACSRACLAKARQILLARRAQWRASRAARSRLGRCRGPLTQVGDAL